MDTEIPDPVTASDIAVLADALSRLADDIADVAGLLRVLPPSSYRPPMAPCRLVSGPATIGGARGGVGTDKPPEMSELDWLAWLALHDEAPPHPPV